MKLKNSEKFIEKEGILTFMQNIPREYSVFL